MPDAPTAWVSEKEDAMQWDVWYDLMVREMSDLSDPGKEKLLQAAAASLPPDAGGEEEPVGPDADGEDAPSDEPSGGASPAPA
jgi:hypothetical protein